jgi:hypothetical protein
MTRRAAVHFRAVQSDYDPSAFSVSDRRAFSMGNGEGSIVHELHVTDVRDRVGRLVDAAVFE